MAYRHSVLFFLLMTRFFLSGMIAVSTVLLAHAGQAASTISQVGGASVTAGKAEVQWRVGYTADAEDSGQDQRFRMRQHVDYGFTDWYALRLVTAQDKRDGDNLEFASVRIENRFQLIERRDYGWDGGVRLLYTHSDGDKTPHEIEFRLMAQVPVTPKLEWRHNTIFEQDIGEDADDGIKLEWRNQLAWSLESPLPEVKKLATGIELFNDLGRLNHLDGREGQEHQLGIMAKGALQGSATFYAGYRFGVFDDDPDHGFSLAVGYRF